MIGGERDGIGRCHGIQATRVQPVVTFPLLQKISAPPAQPRPPRIHIQHDVYRNCRAASRTFAPHIHDTAQCNGAGISNITSAITTRLTHLSVNGLIRSVSPPIPFELKNRDTHKIFFRKYQPVTPCINVLHRRQTPLSKSVSHYSPHSKPDRCDLANEFSGFFLGILVFSLQIPQVPATIDFFYGCFCFLIRLILLC